jgi:Uma2 family endonuclease
MVVELLTDEETLRALAPLLRPEPTADGFEPEGRVVICGVSWERYLALDNALGDDRPGPRLDYPDGDLGIVTTSQEHELIKKWAGDLLAVYFEEADIEVIPRGQATLRTCPHSALSGFSRLSHGLR